MNEGLHSFDCWGARRKQREWETKNLHRHAEWTALTIEWYEILKKDALKAAQECPVCRGIFPKKSVADSPNPTVKYPQEKRNE
jgi:hypothetical protein